jgi:hypothetical protein
MQEPLVDYYFEQLNKSDNKVATLVAFYKAVFNLELVNNTTYSSFGRLVRLYGDRAIFSAILDASGMDNINFDSNIFGLLAYFCKQKILNTKTDAVSLMPLAEKNASALLKKKKLKLPKEINE